jgi:biotin carboxyl carrier protein
VRLIARHDGQEIPVEIERAGSGYRIRIGERWIVADLVEAGPSMRSLRLEDGTQVSFVHHVERTEHTVTMGDSTIHLEMIDPLALRRARREDETGGNGVIKALMPGRIVRVLVNKGDRVSKGDGLLILEAMKMENEIQAPADGVVDEIFVEAAQTVESGADLVHVAAG